MKGAYVKEIKQAFKSAEYWFVFIMIIFTSAWTAIYNLDEYGVLYKTNIGMAEFFFACLMLGNTLLQITAPIIPIFVSMHAAGLYSIPNGNLNNEKEHTIVSRILSTITISASVFLSSFLLIAVIGMFFFPLSTGNIVDIGGPFSTAYYNCPFALIPLTILYSCIFACSYSLLGMGIGMNLKNNKLLAIIIPEVYYFCLTYVARLLPTSIQNVVYWIVPIDTFNLVGTIPLFKKVIEISLVFVIAFALIIIAEKRNKKIRHQDEASMISS